MLENKGVSRQRDIRNKVMKGQERNEGVVNVEMGGGGVREG